MWTRDSLDGEGCSLWVVLHLNELIHLCFLWFEMRLSLFVAVFARIQVA